MRAYLFVSLALLPVAAFAQDPQPVFDPSPSDRYMAEHPPYYAPVPSAPSVPGYGAPIPYGQYRSFADQPAGNLFTAPPPRDWSKPEESVLHSFASSPSE